MESKDLTKLPNQNGETQYPDFSTDLNDSGVDLACTDGSDDSVTLTPCMMSQVRPSPKACLTVKVSALSDVTRDSLYSGSQQVIDDLNSKRKQDTQLLEDFKKAVEEQTERACGRLEQQLYAGYEKRGSRIQAKLHQLYQCLGRVQKIEEELQQFRHALQGLYRDMNHTGGQPDQQS